MLALLLTAGLQLDAAPPRLRAGSATMRIEDYPTDSLRDQEFGIVSVLLEVTAQGRVGECKITESSGFARLDGTTCRLLTARTRFEPAIDAAGQAVAGDYRLATSWGVDNHQPTVTMDLALDVVKLPAGYHQSVKARVVFDGRRSAVSCDITASSGNADADADACDHVRKGLTLPGSGRRSSATTAAVRYVTISLIAGNTPTPGAARAGNVGFETARIAGSAGETLDIGIWYPTTAASSRQRLGPYSQDVAPDAPLVGKSLPMVLISHGSGGWFGGHFDTAIALAKAGFVVAAVTHKGDSSDDGSRRAEVWIRPPQLRRLADHLLKTWSGRASIAADRIGVFGFSAGGFTALVAAGATPHLDRVLPYCQAHPRTQTCAVVSASSEQLKRQAVGVPATAWTHDRRIKAAVVAAPALGFTFGKDGLRNVHVPLLLWRAEHDEVLPYPDYADAVRADLPTSPDFHVAAGAGHYAFLPPCPPGLATDVPEICEDRNGFDRARFHDAFNRSIVTFFERALPSHR